MKKKNLKNKNGITLIALVVTIVVLLILAGVSISMLIGENGIITKANNAKKQSTIAEEKEQIRMAYLASKTNSLGEEIQDSDFQKEIEKIIGNKAETMEGKPLKILFKDTKNLYEIDSNGKITKIEGKLDERGYLIVESTPDEWVYTVSSSGIATLTKYIGQNTEVTVPNYINEDGTLIRVTGIKGERGNRNIFGGTSNTTKTKVIISDGIKVIGQYCFNGCTGLKSINIPNSVESIQNTAFSRCTNLEEINIASNVTSIDKKNMSATKWLADLKNNNPNSLIYAGNSLIDYTGTGYTMPIREDTTVIAESAFENCTELKTIEIPNSVITISAYAFEGCSGLENINIPENVITIGDYAFYRCLGLENINISESVTTIGKYAFCSCTSLKSIDIPGTVTIIGEQAFSSSGLEKVNIQGVKTIERYAFSCCNEITNIILGEGIESIGVGAFDKCYSIKELIFPESLIELGEYVWSSDISLETVIFKGNTPPDIIKEVFMGWDGENIKVIYVPAESVEAYKTTFSDIADLFQANSQN